jgi:hypothetical protein
VPIIAVIGEKGKGGDGYRLPTIPQVAVPVKPLNGTWGKKTRWT